MSRCNSNPTTLALHDPEGPIQPRRLAALSMVNVKSTQTWAQSPDRTKLLDKTHCDHRKGGAPTSTKQVLAAPTSTRAAEDMAGTVVESNSNDPDYRWQLLSKSFVKSLPDTRSQIELVLNGLCVVVKANNEGIVDSLLTRWTSSLQLQIVRATRWTSGDALQESYLNSNSALKTAVFKKVEQAPGEVVQSSIGPSVAEVKMRSIGQASHIAYKIAQSALSSTWFIVLIVEIESIIVGRPVDENGLHEVDNSNFLPQSVYQSSPAWAYKAIQNMSYSESHEPRSICRHLRGSSHRNRHKTLYRMDFITISDRDSLTSVPSVRAITDSV